MRELMLELLTYEPYGKPLPEEEQYIKAILGGNTNPPQAVFHSLFSGFYNCCQQGNYTNIGWLAQWKAAYGSKHLPLFFKKICFYLIVKGNWTESDLMAQIGLRVSCIRKWNISPEYRKKAEKNTYCELNVYRNGVKKWYIVSVVKKLYYEAGRQAQESKDEVKKQSMTLSKLPHFVDVFSGTACVAASVATDGCKRPPIVNDYDPLMICLAWAFAHYPRRLRRDAAAFHEYLMTRDLESIVLSYDENNYEWHNRPDSKTGSKNRLQTSPEEWDDPKIRRLYLEFYGYSEDDIASGKALAQCYQEFIIRARSGYRTVYRSVIPQKSDLVALRKIDFSSSAKHSAKELKDILDYALAMFFYSSFSSGVESGGVYYFETNVDEDSYLNYLKKWSDQLSYIKGKDVAKKAEQLMELRLTAPLLTLMPGESYSKRLNKAEFCCKDFRDILANNLSGGLTDDSGGLTDDDNERIYYLDSPYFLTSGYAVGFSDSDHKDMLDILREAQFKFFFSIQYKESSMDTCTVPADESKRKKELHIKDYGTYYRGFYAKLQPDADEKTLISNAAPSEAPSNLYAILFDFDACRRKWPNDKIKKTTEMLIVNFNCLRTVPLNDTAVVLPFSLFLECADAGDKYSDIVKKAIEWRKGNVSSSYKKGHPV